MSDSKINQHKRLAMGDKPSFKRGGPVAPSFKPAGTKDTPLENAKRANGVKGMKKGGGC